MRYAVLSYQNVAYYRLILDLNPLTQFVIWELTSLLL